jgi:acetyl-CoA C-acetyltransferase
VSWPHTRNTVACIDVDMAAAIMLASTATADALGVPQEKRLFLRGWAYGEDAYYPAQRDDLTSFPAMRELSQDAFAQAGLGLDDMTYVDIYGCFAVALRFATQALALDPYDQRGLTVTGGLHSTSSNTHRRLLGDKQDGRPMAT